MSKTVRIHRKDYTVCCSDFAAATERGTDNEGYGAVISPWDGDSWMIGSYLSPAVYCPWCGTATGLFSNTKDTLP